MTPIKAIRAFCVGCMNGQLAEIRLCPCTDCALFPFRLGKDPARCGRKLSEAQKAAAAENLARARQAKNTA